jgi:hypothetical protein
VCVCRVVVDAKLNYLKQTGKFLDGRNNGVLAIMKLVWGLQ